jgi:hypothetical protein
VLASLVECAETSSRENYPKGLDYMLQATDLTATQLSNPTIGELEVVLSVLVSATNEIILRGVDEEEKQQQVTAKRAELEERLATVKFLGSTTGREYRLSAQLLGAIRSPSHLFRMLVRQGSFAVAELLWRRQLIQSSSTCPAETVIRPMLKIQANVHPIQYVNLLTQVVFPSLTSIGHELLSPLRSWACRTADDLDDNASLGLDAAIVLLEVSKAEGKSFLIRSSNQLLACYRPLTRVRGCYKSTFMLRLLRIARW